MSPSRLPDPDEASGAFLRRHAAEEEPTAEVDLGQGRKVRLSIPTLPPLAWVAIALLSGGTGTTVGTFLAVDWLGLRAREEASALRLQMAEQRHAYELAAIRCGCPGPAGP